MLYHISAISNPSTSGTSTLQSIYLLEPSGTNNTSSPASASANPKNNNNDGWAQHKCNSNPRNGRNADWTQMGPLSPQLALHRHNQLRAYSCHLSAAAAVWLILPYLPSHWQMPNTLSRVPPPLRMCFPSGVPDEVKDETVMMSDCGKAV